MGAGWGDRVLHDFVPLVEILLKVLEDDLLYYLLDHTGSIALNDFLDARCSVRAMRYPSGP